MDYNKLSFAVCDKYKIWCAETMVGNIIKLHSKLSLEEVVTNFDKIDKELIESSEKTAKFLYKTLSDYLDNVFVKVDFIATRPFWSVYLDGKTICQGVSRVGVINRAFDIIIKETNKEQN